MVVVDMDATDLRIPDVPLAHLEDDLECLAKIGGDIFALTDEEVNDVCGHGDEMDEKLTGSLEDLVGTFDQKISQCCRDLGEKTEQMAPVQMRTQEEIMTDSQLWWTLTGNFGNILPLDWTKTEARKLQLNALGLRPRKQPENNDPGLELSDDEELRAALDMHQLISQQHAFSHAHDSPPQTADQVIEEIDLMLQSCDGSVMTDRTMESVDSMYSSMRSPGASSARDPELEAKIREAAALVANPGHLQQLPYNKLVGLSAELEQLIQIYNESLVQELALKDELDYEKEMKNTFISLLLSIQNKRRQHMQDRRRKGMRSDNGTLPQYMTATIPYQENRTHYDTNTLHALIKILRAINEDNTAVPSMLTDYILTVICPSPASSLHV